MLIISDSTLIVGVRKYTGAIDSLVSRLITKVFRNRSNISKSLHANVETVNVGRPPDPRRWYNALVTQTFQDLLSESTC